VKTIEKTEAACSSVQLARQVGRIAIDGTIIELDALEHRMFAEHTEKRPICCEGLPDAHTVWLRVGVQQFCLSGTRETAAEAEWMRSMLAKALANVVRDAQLAAADEIERLRALLVASRPSVRADFTSWEQLVLRKTRDGPLTGTPTCTVCPPRLASG
jgi:hypothetical protein